MLIAVTATAIGYGIDSGAGHKELTGIFAGLYIAGCVVAVLAVRQEGLFTAVIQPPLILFCAVPGAYWLFHGGKIGSVKDLLINCGYPLIERFPLMLGAAGGVLLIGLIRWYLGMSQRPATAGAADDAATPSATVAEKSPFFRAISSKLNSLLGVASSDDEADEEEATDSPRSHSRGSAQSSRTARSGRPATGSTRSRSRHARPSPEEEYDPTAERPRRRRQTPPRDYDPADPARRPSRRRPRPDGDPDGRGQSQREGRRDPRRRNPYERPAARGGRYEDYDRYGPPVSSEPFGRYPSYEPYESYQPAPEQRRRQAAPNGRTGANPTHHPISQVRYRGSGPADERRGEPRGDRRNRPRTNGRSQEHPPADSWEYDA
nr:membrane protein [Mycobacterium florentinum]